MKIYLRTLLLCLMSFNFGCQKNLSVNSSQDADSVHSHIVATKQSVSPIIDIRQKAVIQVSVVENRLPLPNVKLILSKSISGLSPTSFWEANTDDEGQALFEISSKSERLSGYYQIQAFDAITDQILSSWGSAPINGGTRISLHLPIGADFNITEFSVSRLLQSPNRVNSNGHSYSLGIYAWRDLMPRSIDLPFVGLIAKLNLTDNAGSDISDKISLEKVWVVDELDIWEVHDFEQISTFNNQLSFVIRNGPFWKSGKHISAVLQFTDSNRVTHLLKTSSIIQAVF